MANTKMYTIFSIKMANWLVRQGHDMLQVIDSPKDPTGYYKAFLFEDTTQLQSDITNYTLSKKKEHNQTCPNNRYISLNQLEKNTNHGKLEM